MTDEKEEKKDEKKPEEETKDEGKDGEDKKERDETASSKKQVGVIKEAREERIKMEAATADRRKLIAEEKELMAEKELGGQSNMNPPAKPKKLTDTEYAEALERGEVNPLKEDGFI